MKNSNEESPTIHAGNVVSESQLVKFLGTYDYMPNFILGVKL